MKNILKKTVSLLCLLALVASFSVVASAQQPISVTIDGEVLNFDVAPQIINDRTMVPMRKIFEYLGAQVGWDPDTRGITATKDGTNISMQIDNCDMYVNGEKITLDMGPVIVDSRTLVPVRAVSEALDAYVGWESSIKTVRILTNNSPIPEQAQGTWRYLYIEKDGIIIPKEEATGMDIFNKDFIITITGANAYLATDDGEVSGAVPFECNDGIYTIAGLTLSFEANLMKLNVPQENGTIVLVKTTQKPEEKPKNIDIVGKWYWADSELPLEQLTAQTVAFYVGEGLTRESIQFNADGTFETYGMAYLWYTDANTGKSFYEGASGAWGSSGTYEINGNAITLHNKEAVFPVNRDADDFTWIWDAVITVDVKDNTLVITNISCDGEYDDSIFEIGKEFHSNPNQKDFEAEKAVVSQVAKEFYTAVLFKDFTTAKQLALPGGDIYNQLVSMESSFKDYQEKHPEFDINSIEKPDMAPLVVEKISIDGDTAIVICQLLGSYSSKSTDDSGNVTATSGWAYTSGSVELKKANGTWYVIGIND